MLAVVVTSASPGLEVDADVVPRIIGVPAAGIERPAPGVFAQIDDSVVEVQRVDELIVVEGRVVILPPDNDVACGKHRRALEGKSFGPRVRIAANQIALRPIAVARDGDAVALGDAGRRDRPLARVRNLAVKRIGAQIPAVGQEGRERHRIGGRAAIQVHAPAACQRVAREFVHAVRAARSGGGRRHDRQRHVHVRHGVCHAQWIPAVVRARFPEVPRPVPVEVAVTPDRVVRRRGHAGEHVGPGGRYRDRVEAHAFDVVRGHGGVADKRAMVEVEREVVGRAVVEGPTRGEAGLRAARRAPHGRRDFMRGKRPVPDPDVVHAALEEPLRRPAAPRRADLHGAVVECDRPGAGTRRHQRTVNVELQFGAVVGTRHVVPGVVQHSAGGHADHRVPIHAVAEVPVDRAAGPRSLHGPAGDISEAVRLIDD